MKKIVTMILAFAFACPMWAQEALWDISQIVSPEIIEDNIVTFRHYAPNADTVMITGDFLPGIMQKTPFGEFEVAGKAQMTRNEYGVWEYTSEPLASELYSYSFIVDGIRTTDPNNVYLVRDIASLTNIFIIRSQSDDAPGNLYSVQNIPHGSIIKRWYHSETLQTERRLTIYTPAGYEQSDERYPVLYLLHGMGGDEEAWSDLGRATQILDNLIACGKAAKMIVVMPNGNVDLQAAPGQTAEGLYKPTTLLPHTMEGTFERAFPEIIAFVDANYRTVASKEERAIAGLSMGGFHALHISRYWPGTFDYVGLFSAAIMPRDENAIEMDVYRDLHPGLKRQRDNGLELYWIACGNTDFLWEENLEFRKTLDVLEFPYTFYESEGGHIWRNWRMYLSRFLPMLFR